MTKTERIVVSAYTGYLMCDFADVQKYREEKLGRFVYTHELAKDYVIEEIKNATKSDFLGLCGND